MAQVWRQAVLSVLFVLFVLSVLSVLSTAAATPPTPSGPSKRHNRAPSGPRYRRGFQRSDTTAPLLRSRGHALTGRHVAQRSKTGARRRHEGRQAGVRQPASARYATSGVSFKVTVRSFGDSARMER